MLQINFMSIACEIALRWMPQKTFEVMSTLVHVMTVSSHYLSQCWPRFMKPYYITRPKWVDSLRHNDTAIWPRWSGSTSVQFIPCCPMAPSHNLNQFSLCRQLSDHCKHISVKFYLNIVIFIKKKFSSNFCRQNGSHIVQPSTNVCMI